VIHFVLFCTLPVWRNTAPCTLRAPHY